MEGAGRAYELMGYAPSVLRGISMLLFIIARRSGNARRRQGDS
jgi:hypothetical protein